MISFAKLRWPKAAPDSLVSMIHIDDTYQILSLVNRKNLLIKAGLLHNKEPLVQINKQLPIDPYPMGIFMINDGFKSLPKFYQLVSAAGSEHMFRLESASLIFHSGENTVIVSLV